MEKEDLNQERLAGFMVAPWLNTFKADYYSLLSDAWRLGLAKNEYYPD